MGVEGGDLLADEVVDLGGGAGQRWEFGKDYFAPSPRYKELESLFYEECEKVGIRTRVPRYEPRPVKEDLAQIQML